MDTRFLETFLAVIEHGSIAHASRHLGLTPATLAQRLKIVEHEIGARLIVRAGRSVQPTAAGLAILDRSRDIIRDLRELRSLASGQQVAGELRLGAIQTAMTGLAPAIVKAMSADNPNVEFYLRPGFSGELYEAVVENRLDAAIIVGPQFDLPKTCGARALRSERLILITPVALRNGDPHDIIRSQPFIRYDRTQWGSRIADDYLDAHGLQCRVRFELDSLESIAVMVNQGLGVSLVPEWASPWPEGLSIERRALPFPVGFREIVLLWTRSAARKRLIDALVNVTIGLWPA